MRTCLAAGMIAVALVGGATGQEMPKPGPEYDVLKKLVGTWDVKMSAGGMDSKGTVTYKFDLGGLWLMSRLEAEMLGQKFTGHGMDSYDATKKKYITIWVDSMSTSPVVMEGTYDAAKKTLSLSGEGPGMDGKPTKYKSTSEMTDADTVKYTMYIGDGKEPTFTITYTRKK